MSATHGVEQVAAVILAGGLGTRLRAVVRAQPKVLAPVRGKPFLAYLLDQLCGAGIRTAVICSGYLGEQIEAAFGSAYGPVRVEYSREAAPLGTGGALRAAAPLLGDHPVLVLNGDSYCELDPRALWAWHAAKGAAASIAVTSVADAARYGQVELDAEGRLLSFIEKGAGRQGGWVNAGVYCVERPVINSIAAGAAVSLEHQVFPQWIGKGLYGFRCEGRFIDIGTPESYRQAEEFFAQAGDGGRTGRT